MLASGDCFGRMVIRTEHHFRGYFRIAGNPLTILKSALMQRSRVLHNLRKLVAKLRVRIEKSPMYSQPAKCIGDEWPVTHSKLKDG